MNYMARRQQQFLTLFVALGAGIGTAIGIAKNELTFYIGMGLVVGLMVGVIFDQRSMVNREVKKSEQKRSTDDIMPRF